MDEINCSENKPCYEASDPRKLCPKHKSEFEAWLVAKINREDSRGSGT